MTIKRKFTPSGTKLVPTYQKEVVDGKVRLVKTGETNRFEEIQQYADLCDINKIIEKCMNGDLSVLNKGHAQYRDFTILPKSLNEYYMLNQQAERNFYDLPVELRKEFDHSAQKFMLELESGEAQKKMDKHFGVKSEKVTEEKTTTTEIQKVEQIMTQPAVNNGVISGQQTINTNTQTGVIYG